MIRRSTPDWLTRWEYAHRGLHSEGAPENSLAAAEAAIAAGMGIECDIQRSADDHAMVFHDWELSRLSDQSGETGERVAEDLERVALLGTNQSPVRLSRFLAEIAGRVPLLIEIKSMPGYNVERTCTRVAELLYEYSAEHAVMSFDPRVPGWFADHSPETVRGLVCTDTLDLGFKSTWRVPGALEAAQADFLALDIRDIPGALPDLWRESGRPLLSWTIRTPDFRETALAHVDALISEGDGLV